MTCRFSWTQHVAPSRWSPMLWVIVFCLSTSALPASGAAIQLGIEPTAVVPVGEIAGTSASGLLKLGGGVLGDLLFEAGPYVSAGARGGFFVNKSKPRSEALSADIGFDDFTGFPIYGFVRIHTSMEAPAGLLGEFGVGSTLVESKGDLQTLSALTVRGGGFVAVSKRVHLTGTLGFLKAFGGDGPLLGDDASIQWVTVAIGARLRFEL
jgi:hypothetical protein